ncbi:MAG: endonuclease domain-containing protein [Pedobacter sp.]|jgi:very-short-patch-repair endonuclease
MDNAASFNLWHYNKALRAYSSNNRRSMTKAEACLWKYSLSKRQMEGYRFLRQRPVLSYIADFMCKELMLIIEVDGLTHQWEEVALNDIKREQVLKEVGFMVLRFNDNDVLNHIDDVSYLIRDYIIDFKKRNSTNLPL